VAPRGVARPARQEGPHGFAAAEGAEAVGSPKELAGRGTRGRQDPPTSPPQDVVLHQVVDHKMVRWEGRRAIGLW